MATFAHDHRSPRARTIKPGGGCLALLLGLYLVVSSLPSAAQDHRLLSLASPPSQLTAATARSTPADWTQLATHDPRTVLEHAHAMQQHGSAFPDPLLKQAVEAALRPETPWAHAEAAIRYFDLYKDRPWAKGVLTPFAMHHARHLLLNADFFATLHREWTKNVLAVAAWHAPRWVLSELKKVVVVDPAWAKQLAATVASRDPVLAFAHADVLLAVDRHWAQGVLQRAVQGAPQKAVSAIRAYLAEPWGVQLFAEAALATPRWTVTVAASQRPESQTVLETLQRSKDPHLRLLAQIAQSGHNGEIASRMGGFVHDIVANVVSLEETARLSKHEQTYFRALVARKLAGRVPQPRVVDEALNDEATLLFQYLNELFDKPDTLRFRIIEPLTARELYAMLAYGEENAISTSYHGAFARLLSRMRQEGLTGEQLLAQVNEVRLRPFVKAAAKFHRLEAFLATIPAPAARLAVLTRCLSGMDRAPDLAVQAALAAEILDAPLDGHSLGAFRDTIVNEYRRVERGKDRQALAIYGLLAARLAQRAAGPPATPEFTTIASKYRPYLPDWHEIPFAQLFHDGLNVQRHFFYNDDDGQGSFRSFVAHYRSAPAWHLEDHNSFVRITSSAPGRRIAIYANKPTDEGERAADIDRLLQQQDVTPQVIVHRGHSPYVAETLGRTPATAALVFLGNCGGYTFLEAVVNSAPEAHVITTTGVGTVAINDPFLKELNEYLLRGKEGRWAEFWRRAASRLEHNPRFADYISPDHNASALLLRAYRNFMDDSRPKPTAVPLRSAQR